MKIFEKHINDLLEFEGGYVDDPIDRGGATKYGISQKAYPRLDIKNLTRQQAKDIYYKDYWYKASCQFLPDYLKFIHFDTAVNSGVRTANRMLQKCIGTVTVDGIIGSKTLAMVSSVTLAQYIAERSLFYAKIVKRNPSQIRFIVGWNNRLKKLAHLVTIALLLVLSSCKSTHTIQTKQLVVNDTLIRHEVKSVQLPVKNVTIIESPCKENELKPISQTVQSGTSVITIKEEAGQLVITQNIDSIVNSKVKEIQKHSSDKIVTNDVLEIRYKVPKWCWYLMIYAVIATLWIFRKPLLRIIKPL